MEIVERRIEERKRRIEEALDFVRSLKEPRPLTAVVIGSTARGDFNEWSDIDVVIISDKFPENSLRRFDMLERQLKPGIEPIPLRLADLRRLIRKRAPILDDIARGIFLIDDLGIREILGDPSRPARSARPPLEDENCDDR